MYTHARGNLVHEFFILIANGFRRVQTATILDAVHYVVEDHQR
jgi:hypothetical protein